LRLEDSSSLDVRGVGFEEAGDLKIPQGLEGKRIVGEHRRPQLEVLLSKNPIVLGWCLSHGERQR
jgi:hypothetical protein